MTEEIKEILFRLEIVARKHTIKVTDTGNVETMPANVVDELRLNNYSAKILLNYITNLQKENENLKEIINDDMTVYLKGLEDGKDKMKEIFESVYKSRNEKAVEYLEHFDSNQICENITEIAKCLLNILKGGDE